MRVRVRERERERFAGFIRGVICLLTEQTPELPPEQVGSVLRLLFASHPYYIDRLSRKAVRRCFLTFCETQKYSEGFEKRIVPAIKNESQKQGIAASNAFVLLEWTAELFPQLAAAAAAAPGGASATLFADLLAATVSLLDICLGSLQAKQGMKQQALRVTRRGLRAMFRRADFENLVSTMVGNLTAKGASPTQKNALLLGIVCGVCARLPKPRQVLERSRKDIYAFYTREILGSRTLVPKHVAGSLGDFFSSFAAAEEFESEVLPSLERGLLRSPEILLNDLVSPLLRSLPSGIDLSRSLLDKLLKQFLSCLKSTNPSIRNGAVAAFQVAAKRSQDTAILEKIAAEILKPLASGKVSSADQRVLYAQMLGSMPSPDTLFKLVPTGLSALVAKEPNEAAMGAIVSTFMRHLETGLAGDIPIDSSVMDAVNRGLTDKRPAARRAWFTKVGDTIWDFPGEPSPALRQFCRGIAGKFSATLSEIAANPMPAAQSGLLVAAYVAAAVILGRLSLWNDPAIDPLIKASDAAEICLTAAPKAAFLINCKIYSKLSTTDDHQWAIRALAATAGYVIHGRSHADLWASAFLYLISAVSVAPKHRKEACAALATAYLKHPEAVGKVVLSGIWLWLGSVERNDKESAAAAAKSGTSHLKNAIYAIALSDNAASRGLETGAALEKETVKNLLVNLTVVSHHELVGVDWIGLCQKAGVDPGQLSAEKATRLLNEIRMYTGLSGRSLYLRKAALKSAATLAFVAPEAITPLLVKLFESDLEPALFKGIGPTEVAIWRTPAGVPFIDVLAKSGPKAVGKSRDAETLKWEAELREQLAKKKGAERKLTADEKAKVDDQLAKEAVVRKQVAEVELKLSRGVGLIQHLAEDAPTAVEMWMYRATKALLGIFEAGAGMIVQDKGIKAFLVRFLALLSCSSNRN